MANLRELFEPYMLRDQSTDINRVAVGDAEIREEAADLLEANIISASPQEDNYEAPGPANQVRNDLLELTEAFLKDVHEVCTNNQLYYKRDRVAVTFVRRLRSRRTSPPPRIADLDNSQLVRLSYKEVRQARAASKSRSAASCGATGGGETKDEDEIQTATTTAKRPVHASVDVFKQDMR